MKPRRAAFTSSPFRDPGRGAAAASAPPAVETYRSIFDNAVLGIFRTTPGGRLIAANRALAGIYGYESAEEMVAAVTDVRRQVYVDAGRRKELDRLLREHGSVSRFEAEVYKKDRSRIWVAISARTVRAGRSIQYYEGTAEDVTDRKRVEIELRRQNELLQTIFDHMPCMFNVLGPRMNPLLVNKEWTRVFGWTAEQLQGRDMLTLMYPSHPAERRRAQQFIQTCGREWHEFRIRDKDGRMVDASWANFRLSDGTVIGIGRDVTEANRAQRALQASLRQQAAVARLGQRVLAGENPDTLCRDLPRLVAETLEVDGSGVFQLLPGGRELLLLTGTGWSPGLVGSARIPARPDSPTGYALSAKRPVIVPDVRADCRFRTHLLKRQGAVSAVVTLIGHPDQPYGVLKAFTRQERVFSEDDLHFLQAIANVLAAAIIRKEHEDVRRQLLERLIAAQEDERRRIARELHDHTGQALTSLLVRLRALEDAKALPQALAQAGSLRRLAARTIGDLGRLARGLSPSVLETLGLRPALEHLATEQAAALGLVIDLDTRRLGSVRLPAEAETALYRIVQEAVANTGRHAAACLIRIALAREDGHVRLVIMDDGRGFDAKPTLRTSAAKGRLGVHGMRERAMLLGGTLEIESKRGAGTTVSVQVPIGRRQRDGRGSRTAGKAS